MDTLGIEPRASRMLSGCDTTTPRALNTQFQKHGVNPKPKILYTKFRTALKWPMVHYTACPWSTSSQTWCQAATQHTVYQFSEMRLRGSWCSGITSASHAEGPGFKSQWVHVMHIQPGACVKCLHLPRGNIVIRAHNI